MTNAPSVAHPARTAVEAERSASTCRWATLTLFLPAPFWFEAETSPWACVRDAEPRVLTTTDICERCWRWEPRVATSASV
jgi:hypothetical protein